MRLDGDRVDLLRREGDADQWRPQAARRGAPRWCGRNGPCRSRAASRSRSKPTTGTMTRSGSTSASSAAGTERAEAAGDQRARRARSGGRRACAPGRMAGSPIVDARGAWAVASIGRRIGLAAHRHVAGDGSRARPPRSPARCVRAIAAEPPPRSAASVASRRRSARSRSSDFEGNGGRWPGADSEGREVRGRRAGGGVDPGDLQSRWAPCIRAHGPGQGQLPLGSIRPRGKVSPAEPRSTRITQI